METKNNDLVTCKKREERSQMMTLLHLAQKKPEDLYHTSSCVIGTIKTYSHWDRFIYWIGCRRNAYLFRRAYWRLTKKYYWGLYSYANDLPEVWKAKTTSPPPEPNKKETKCDTTEIKNEL